MAITPATAFGSNSYLLARNQTAYGTPRDNTDLIATDRLYEIESSTLAIQQETINPERSKGNSSPTKLIGGQVSAEGNVTIQADTSHMGIWLHNMLMDDDPVTRQIGTGNLLAAATSYTVDTAITTFTAQPSAVTRYGAANSAQPPIKGGLIDVVFSSAAVAGTTNSLALKGEDSAGRPIEETVTFTSIPSDNTISSTLFYTKLDSLTISGPTTAGTITVNANPGLYEHVLEPKDTLLNGMTIELVRGSVPSLYHSLLVNTGTITLGDVISLSLDLLGQTGITREGAGGTSSATATANLNRPAGDVAVGWGTELKLDGDPFAVSAASFTTTNNLEIPATKYYRSLNSPRPVRGANRQNTITATIDYSSANDFDSKAYGTDIEVDLGFASLPYGLKPAFIEISMPQARLAQFPDPGVSGQGPLTQDLTLEGYANPANSTATPVKPEELTITVYNGETEAAFKAGV